MQVIEQPTDRLNLVIERLIYYHQYAQTHYGCRGRNWLENELGLSVGYLTKSIHKKSAISSELIVKIHEIFPKLNILWLVLGEGNMEKQ